MITLHRHHRMDRLAEILGGRLLRPLPDSAAPEIVSVQSLAMRAWLEMQIAERLGICANVVFPFPRELIGELLRAVLDDGERPPDPFQREALAWSIMNALPPLLTRASFEPLSRYLAGGSGDATWRCFQLARRIADTFDQYVLYRPEMVLAWDQGRAQGPDGPLSPGDRWQMELWQALVERHGPCHAAARVRLFCERAPAAAERLPRRVFLFGITSLPPLYLDVLSSLPAGAEAHLFLLSLSPSQRRRARAACGDEAPDGNPALAALGRSARAFERLLETRARTQAATGEADGEPAPVSGEPVTVLRSLQEAVFHDRDVADPAPADGSLSLHACHGRLREVEALRDQILDLFEKDPTLEPRDVVVLAPDIEEYAPLIDAVFAAPPGPGHIPYTIAGRPLRAGSPLMEAFFAVLDLARRRLTLPEVFDLLSLDPVRRKFSLSPDDVEQLRELSLSAGIRWGRDAAHREEHGQPALADFTFRFGLDRLLLGVAMPSDRLFAGVCPLSGPEGKEAQIVGRLAAFCKVLFENTAGWARPRSLDAWRQDLERLLERLLTDDEAFAADRQRLREALAALSRRARAAGFAGEVDLPTVRGALAEEFSSEAGRGRYFGGGVTFASLLPMRGIPFRVIGLLGMSDEGFPRARGAVGFDLIARHPRPGDRSLRDDDLSQFLETAMSAGERLLIVYPGQGIRDNQPRPLSVAVAAFVDCLPAVTRAAIEVRHPLQPFSRRYFDGSDPRLFSFDERYLAGARGAPNAGAPAPFLDAPLAAPERGEVTLDELCDFFRSPVERFFRERLGIRFSRRTEEDPQREPLALDSLASHLVRAWLLERALDGAPDDREDRLRSLRARGMLPPGRLGEVELERLTTEIEPVVQEAQRRAQRRKPQRVEVAMEAGGWRFDGVVERVFPEGRLVVDAGRRNGKRLLDLWIRHLALCCAPGPQRKSVLVCRNGKDGLDVVELPFVPQAAAHLEELLQIYGTGQRQPLPFFPKASFAYAEARRGDGQDARQALSEAKKLFFSQWNRPGEVEPIRECVRCAFGAEEAALQTAEFGSLAWKVFRPLVDVLSGAAP